MFLIGFGFVSKRICSMINSPSSPVAEVSSMGAGGLWFSPRLSHTCDLKTQHSSGSPARHLAVWSYR